MKISLFSVFALCFNGVVVVEAAAPALPEIDRYELLPAVHKLGYPSANITSVTPYKGIIHFEEFKNSSGNFKVQLFPSYNNETLVCEGQLLADIAGPKLSATGFNVTRSNSHIKGFEFATRVSSTKNGTQSLCARLYLSKPTQSVPMFKVSWLDTAFDLKVALSGGFSTFTQEVKMKSLKGNKESGTIGKIVAVDSFLCGEDNVTAYGIGQSFSLCLDASSAYNITSVKNVVCENSGSKRQLVDSAGKKDVFTSFNRAVGIKSNDNKKTGSRGSYRINSVVTAGYFSNKATSFSCTGEAAVVTYPTLRRSLTTSVSFPSFGQKSSFRDLQESTLPESSNELSETPFSTIVGIFEPDDLDIMEASAFFHGYVGLGSSFVAGAAMIMIAAM
mmetsp:Transcript_23406/g.49158  ORF Transcript_23406/g.49158 Transcript_23406/m.49158 type:complete len:389 (-) Transcript_23406:188-1354(-)